MTRTEVTDNILEIEGDMVCSLRHCGDGGGYAELDTWKASDGKYYNIRFECLGGIRYRLRVEVSKSPMVTMSDKAAKLFYRDKS